MTGRPSVSLDRMPAVAQRARRRRVRRSWAPLLATAIAVGILTSVVWRLDWSTLASLGTAHAWVLVGIAALAQLATLPLKALAWRSSLAAALTGGTAVPLRVVFSPVMIGALLNLVLAGRVGEAARVLLARARLHRSGRTVDLSVVIGSAVTESLVSTIAWVGLVAVAGAFLGLPEPVWLALAGLAAIWLLIVIGSARNWWSAPPASASGRLSRRIVQEIRRVWNAVARGHRALAHPGVLVPLGGASIAGWLAQWLSVYTLLRAFDIEGGWRAATLILIAVSLAQTLPLLPGNVGLFQAAAALPLVTSYAVPPATAVAFGLVLQLVQTLPIVVAGAVALAREGESVRHLLESARRLRSRSARMPA